MQNFIKNSIQSQKVFYRYFRRKGFRRFLKENVLESEGSNETKAKSIALGIFIGISPFWGLHSFLAISLSVYFKLNKVLTFMASQITFPPLIPFIIFLSVLVGAPFVGGETSFENITFNTEFIKSNLLQYIVGSLILAASSGVFFGFLSYFVLRLFNKK
ncbi:DUF2062 domain-containing protein [Chryseobacterium koreense]|uniref:DUF2062 domain-containing protein n=1 Tax=Chryseobacterium koreense TaxID=232216 RepID=UPI00069F0175|nr:DUF2062 domain-containing protein [Chryseobacterium koreense]MBB5333887.1 uncharacterized protein (DUF2062 family) [Chryseobacterium koreense]